MSVHCAGCRNLIVAENERKFVKIRKPNDSLTQKDPRGGKVRDVEDLQNVIFKEFEEPQVTCDVVTKKKIFKYGILLCEKCEEPVGSVRDIDGTKRGLFKAANLELCRNGRFGFYTNETLFSGGPLLFRQSGVITKLEKQHGFITSDSNVSTWFSQYSFPEEYTPELSMRVTFIRLTSGGKSRAIQICPGDQGKPATKIPRKASQTATTSTKTSSTRSPSKSKSATDIISTTLRELERFDTQTSADKIADLLKQLHSATQDPSVEQWCTQELAKYICTDIGFQEVLLNVLLTQEPQQVLQVFAPYIVLVLDLTDHLNLGAFDCSHEFFTKLPGFVQIRFPEQIDNQVAIPEPSLKQTLLDKPSGSLVIIASKLLESKILV
mmetsp:Transcript_8320/g.15506  ORF Transcript_8320/g.15506 Transcript_8320/m.15506 type:complete len:380 (+) Transcript_8320:236-1375(+)